MGAAIRKGDTVLVISGKDKGKRGKVIRVDPDKRRLVVEGVNMGKKHVRPNRKVMQGGIIDQEMPLAVSNVMLVCTRCNEPTRIGAKELEDGKKVRVCKQCGEVIDK